MSKRPRLIDTLTNSSIRDVGRAVGDLAYRKVFRQRAMVELQREVGARHATLDAIAEKSYEQLGGTEISHFLNSAFSNQPKINLEILAGLYETHPWVKICTRYIATSLAGIPLRVKRAVAFEDGKEIREPADDSPVGRMFRWINHQQSPYSFMEDLASWLILCGEAYVVFADRSPSAPSGVPAEMFVLLTPFVEKVVSPSKQIVGLTYQVGGESAFFDAREFAYFKTWSPAGRFRGQGEAAAGRSTIATDQQLRDFNRNVLQQGVHLSGVLETDNEDLGKEDAEVIRKSFEAQYSGASKAAKLAVLWGGLKFSPQTILQKDIMMSEQISHNRDEIIALFGLKPELLTEKFANKATAETVRRMAFEDVILGQWGANIASAFNATGLMRFDPNLRVEFDARDVPALQTSTGEKVTNAAAAVSGGLMTINEARDEFLGLPPIDGAEADTIFINGTPAALALEGPSPVPMLPAAAGGKGGYLEAEYVEVGETRLPPATALAKRLALDASRFGVADQKVVSDRLIFSRLRETSDARLERALRSIYRDIQKDIRTTMTRSSIDHAILAKIEQIFLFDGRSAIATELSRALKISIEDAVALEIASLRIEGTFDIKPVRALARLNSQEQRIRNVSGRQWVRLRSDIAEGLAAGESQAKLIARTSAFFDGMRNNAATIARTETVPAINGAAMDVALQARKAGVDVVSMWETAGGELVRTPPTSQFNHAQAHGLTIIPGVEMFKVSGETLEFPGDSWNGASPGNTINCRCGVRNEVRSIRPSDNRGE